MIAAGNICELHVYEGFGHLFTPAGVPDAGQPAPDPATRADALAKAERFLKPAAISDEGELTTHPHRLRPGRHRRRS